MIVFDIETGPLPIEQIRQFMPPFDGHPGDFDPRSVKLGNLKDEAKITAKIEEAAAAHRAALASVKDREAEHERKFLERAALSPLTGRVLAIGTKYADALQAVFHVGGQTCSEDKPIDEAWLIKSLWSAFSNVERQPFVGHNIFGFDLPFLVRRSWLLGIDVPDHIRSGRYWSPIFVDTMDVWGLGSRDFVALDTLAKACSLPGKPDGVNGGQFAELLATNRNEALAYLFNDLELTWAVASRLQIF